MSVERLIFITGSLAEHEFLGVEVGDTLAAKVKPFAPDPAWLVGTEKCRFIVLPRATPTFERGIYADGVTRNSLTANNREIVTPSIEDQVIKMAENRVQIFGDPIGTPRLPAFLGHDECLRPDARTFIGRLLFRNLSELPDTRAHAEYFEDLRQELAQVFRHSRHLLLSQVSIMRVAESLTPESLRYLPVELRLEDGTLPAVIAFENFQADDTFRGALHTPRHIPNLAPPFDLFRLVNDINGQPISVAVARIITWVE